MSGPLACACALALAGCAAAQPLPEAPRSADPESTFAEEALARHNAERERKGLKALRWSDKLAREARSWADRLASENAMRHADARTRGGAGESLWMGLAGRYRPAQMIDFFLEERKNFQPGVFPQVSRTGNWMDVGHYTQVVWPSTTEVGCALARGPAHDFLVCRYRPPGNVPGVRVD